jgi:hypothetical protein
LFGNLASGHFSANVSSLLFTSSDAGSNDTSLKSLSCWGAEPIKGQTNEPTFEYYNIDHVKWGWIRLCLIFQLISNI